ncbi:MAG: sugar ABC transporter permease [Chloroflexota bacterium]
MASVALKNDASRWHRLRLRFESAGHWVYLLPALVFFIGYQLYPILSVLWMSFTDFHYLRSDQPNFIGLQNYINAINDPLVWQGLGRALAFTILFLPGCIFIPLFIAILVDRVKNERVSSIYKIILLLPAVIPGPMIFVLWTWLYGFDIGPINHFLVEVLHIFNYRNAPQWLGNSLLTLPAIAIMEVWWGLGYHTIFFLAGLAYIPHELFEAAKIDGANEWQMFWHVTLPRLRPVMIVLVVLRFGTAMAVIDEFLIMGGFNRALPTYTWTVYMWQIAFQLGDWYQGYAAAIGWIGAIAMLFVVGGLFYLFRNRD